MTSHSIAMLVQDFFLNKLTNQKNASPRTIASYRDTFRLLFSYVHEKTGKPPCETTLDELSAPIILQFLSHLENERGNGVRTRNVRLAAIRSFFHHLAYLEPQSLGTIQAVLALPSKRSDRSQIGFLTAKEIEAILAVPDARSWGGNRDRAMFATLYNTGARVSEISALRHSDLRLGDPAVVTLHGKGRKERTMPLWRQTARLIKDWLAHCPGAQAGDPLFPNARGGPMSRFGIEHRLRLATSRATSSCPTLQDKKVSPHVIRHTTAMHLLQSGVDINVIALWLGHESPVTTHHYLEADVVMKERILQKLSPPHASNGRFKADDPLLHFLATL